MAIVYNLKVFDGSITGAAAADVVYTPAEMNPLLSRAEKWLLFVRTSQGTGSPTLTVVLEHSNDNVNWATKTTLLSAVTVATAGVGTHYASDLGASNVGGAFMRLKMSLAGSTPSANLQVWLTGRTEE